MKTDKEISPYGRAIAMLTLYLDKRIDQDCPELEQLVDSVPLGEVSETIWELLDIFSWATSILSIEAGEPNDDAVRTVLRGLAVDRQLWDPKS